MTWKPELDKFSGVQPGNTGNFIKSDGTNWQSGSDLTPIKKVYAQWIRCNNTTVEFYVSQMVNNSGTATAATDNTGVYVNCASSITDSTAGWGVGGSVLTRRELRPILAFVFKTGPNAADIQNVNIGCGITTANDVANPPFVAAAPTKHSAWIRYATSVDGTAFFRLVTGDGTAETTTVTTIAVAVDTRYVWFIDMSVSGKVIFKCLNESTGAVTSWEHTTNLPGIDTNLTSPFCCLLPKVNTAKNFKPSIMQVHMTG